MITCRTADLNNPDDIEFVVNSTSAYYADEQGMGVPMPEEVVSRLRSRLSDMPGLRAGLAFVNNEFAGSALCVQSFGSFLARPILNIHDLSVLPEFRGKGVGSALLEWSENYARETDCSHVTLEVSHDNPTAQRLYRSRGYSIPDSTSAPCTYFGKKAL